MVCTSPRGTVCTGRETTTTRLKATLAVTVLVVWVIIYLAEFEAKKYQVSNKPEKQKSNKNAELKTDAKNQ